MSDFARLRERMVERQVAGRGIADARLLAAMRSVPRELFVSEHLQEIAYEDSPLPIEADQTISQPFIVAMMAQAAEIEGGEQILEIGAGSGYAAAVIGRIAAKVWTIERHRELCDLARDRLDRLGFTNVEVRCADGSLGWPEKAPFDAILAAASGSHIPDTLRRQLAIGGRLVMPIGEPNSVQKLIKVTRVSEEEFEQEDLGPVRFVPLIGAHGWREEEGEGHEPSGPELIRTAEPLPSLPPRPSRRTE